MSTLIYGVLIALALLTGITKSIVLFITCYIALILIALKAIIDKKKANK